LTSNLIYAGAQEVEIKNGQTTVKTYWPAGLGVEIDKPGSSASELNWTHLDRLGSVVGITDASGNLKEKLAYDAWGKRRTFDSSAVNGTLTPDSLDGQTDNKGYTGHEMLDDLDLVHMNGRVYDPLVAKFLSGDPLVQDPVNGQNYNRYSYVLNNPTNLTDPTGFAYGDAMNRKFEMRRGEAWQRSLTPASGPPRVIITCDAICQAKNGIGTVLRGAEAREFLAQMQRVSALGLNIAKNAATRFIFVTASTATVGILAAVLPGNIGQENKEAAWEEQNAKKNAAAAAAAEQAAGADSSEALSGTNSAAGGGAEDPDNNRKDKNKDKNRNADGEQPASDKTAKDMGRRIEKDIGGKDGKQAARDFHDMKERGAPDRSMQQLKNDAIDVYHSYGQEIPKWLK